MRECSLRRPSVSRVSEGNYCFHHADDAAAPAPYIYSIVYIIRRYVYRLLSDACSIWTLFSQFIFIRSLLSVRAVRRIGRQLSKFWRRRTCESVLGCIYIVTTEARGLRLCELGGRRLRGRGQDFL